MLIKKIYDTFYHGIGIMKPTSLQKEHFKNQFNGRELTLCGVVLDVESESFLKINNKVSGYMNSKEHGQFTFKTLEIVISADLSVKTNQVNLHEYNRGEIIEVTGQIRSINPESYKPSQPYPTVKLEDEDRSDSFILTMNFGLEDCVTKKISSSWLDRNFFDLRDRWGI